MHRESAPSPRTLAIARWLLGFLRKADRPTPLHEVFRVAGPLGHLGKSRYLGESKSWANIQGLYDARRAVPNLTGTDSGWLIDELEIGGRKHWRPIRTPSSPSINQFA